MADPIYVDGANREHKVMLFALSTCGWCKKTKKLLEELNVAYDYIDVDLLAGNEKDRAREEITRWNPACSFPTLVVDNQRCIAGFKEWEIREVLG
jgi:glutaredoxin-like protein NrdH